MKRVAKKQAVSFRLDADLENPLKEWLEKNPSVSFSVLANMALREFISQDHKLSAVELVTAGKQQTEKSISKMIKKHKDTLDKLK